MIRNQKNKGRAMLVFIVNIFVCIATGFIGGFVAQNMGGMRWGIAVIIGYWLGFWLYGYLK